MSDYPNARKYIKDLDSLDKETKETYEFEAGLCESVIQIMGSHECPKCKGRVFKIAETIVDFNFPFVDGRRIRVLKSLLEIPYTSEIGISVKCEKCGFKKESQ